MTNVQAVLDAQGKAVATDSPWLAIYDRAEGGWRTAELSKIDCGEGRDD